MMFSIQFICHVSQLPVINLNRSLRLVKDSIRWKDDASHYGSCPRTFHHVKRAIRLG